MTWAVSEAKLTVALTPGIELRVRSIVATHEEQVIPPTLSVIGSRAVLNAGAGTFFAILVVCVIELLHHLVKKNAIGGKAATVMWSGFAGN